MRVIWMSGCCFLAQFYHTFCKNNLDYVPFTLMAVCAFTIDELNTLDEYDPKEMAAEDLSLHISLHDLKITLRLQR